MAFNLLWASELLRQLPDAAADELASSIINRLPNLTFDEVNGYQWMLSGLRSNHDAAYKRIREAIPARVLAERLSLQEAAGDLRDRPRRECPDHRRPRRLVRLAGRGPGQPGEGFFLAPAT